MTLTPLRTNLSHEIHEDKRSPSCRSPGVLLAACLLAVSFGAEPSGAAAPWRVEIAFNNDFLTNNTVKDDFYTFAGRLAVTYGDLTYEWDENAFTDRAGGLRFDETYVTVGRFLPDPWMGKWNAWIEGGVAHVGEGLLGQSAQNEVHDLLGEDRVRLDYLAGVDDYHPHLQAEIGRRWTLGERWNLGPQLGLGATIGFRWNVLAGVRAAWRPSDRFAVDATVGARYTDTELALLAPHLEEKSLAALVAIDLPLGFFVEWSLNRYGTDREHVTFGFSLGPGDDPRRGGFVP